MPRAKKTRARRAAVSCGPYGLDLVVQLCLDFGMQHTRRAILLRAWDLFDSPLGRMVVAAGDRGLAGVWFVGQKNRPRPGRGLRRAPRHRLLVRAKRELAEYFSGRRRAFELPLEPQGTPFQRAVWKAIATVRYGETISYAELARRAGHAGAARAAAAAAARNPIGVVVPCHRIVAAGGALTGYAGGLAKKRALLALEAATMASGRRRT
jgi:methylated-DNA-[protein]-cysteine S-methyltransferase